MIALDIVRFVFWSVAGWVLWFIPGLIGLLPIFALVAVYNGIGWLRGRR